jgi:hypothetical protein
VRAPPLRGARAGDNTHGQVAVAGSQQASLAAWPPTTGVLPECKHQATPATSNPVFPHQQHHTALTRAACATWTANTVGCAPVDAN